MIDILSYVLKIRDLYREKTHDWICCDLLQMIRTLDVSEYNNFEKCTVIVQNREFVLLTYSIIKGGDSDLFTNPDSIYRNCRGTVIDMKCGELVLLPFRKFFNIGEISETSLSVVAEKLKNAHIVEITDKMDGSMISVTQYHGEIFLAGSGSLTEEKNSRLKEARYYLLEGYKALCSDWQEYTFMFELIGKEPQIVQYPRDKWGLYLTGARRKSDGELLTYSKLKYLAGTYHIPMVNIESLSFNEILEKRKDYSCLEKEGWVLRVDDTLYKVKCEDFASMHRLASTNPNGILNLWREGKLDDIKSRMSDSMREYVERYTDRFHIYARRMTEEINSLYSKYSDIDDMKEFALAIKNLDKKTQGYMFCLKRGKPMDIFKGVEYSDIENYLS